MTRKIVYSIILTMLCALQLQAQDAYNERAKKYVAQYYSLAIAEQRASGIPASITLGQGILETEAGASELMLQANNHFGIKCKNGWAGPTFLHTDDAKDECFKKYADASESFKDHSYHLIRNPRYASLFKCSQTDYAAWAVGLKRCGYATNPQYAQRLIKIIEDFKLQEYTYSALDTTLTPNYPALVDVAPNPAVATREMRAKRDSVKTVTDTFHIVAAPSRKDSLVAAKKSAIKYADVITKPTVPAAVAEDTLNTAFNEADTDPLRAMADSLREVMRHHDEQAEIHAAAASDTAKMQLVNGLRAFYAHKDEMLLEYAVKYKVRYPHLLELNDLNDAPLPFDMYVYLEKKLTSGTRDKHTVKEGETLLMVAQAEGMQLRKLAALNMLAPGEEPIAGAVLELQTPPGKKPLTRLIALKAHKGNAINGDNKADSGWVDTYQAPVYSSLENNIDSPVKEQPAAARLAKKQENKPMYSASFAAAEETPKQEKTTTPAKPKELQDPALYRREEKYASMKDEAPQPQLKKPATEKEYKKGDKYYIVKRGDTAYSIAKNNGVTVAQILKWNDTEPQDIKAGQTIRVQE